MRTEEQIRDQIKSLEADLHEMEADYRTITSGATYAGIEDDKLEVEQALQHLRSSLRTLRWVLDEEALT